MAKTTVTKRDNATPEFKKGELFISTDGNDYIVMITGDGKDDNCISCVVLNSEDSRTPVGTHRKDALKSLLKPFYGTLTITN